MISAGPRQSINTATPSGRMDNIDLMRAVAILSVLVYHYTTRFDPAFYRTVAMPFRFETGKFGVDLFFTVSGFCIFMTLERSATLAVFWAKRIARIQPAYIAGIALTFAAVHVFGLPGRSVGLGVALGNAVWLNLVNGFPMVDGAYWSLVVELKFYFWIGIIHAVLGGRRTLLAWAAFTVAGCVLEQVAALHQPMGAVCGRLARLVMISPHSPMFLVGLIAWRWPQITSRWHALSYGALAVGLCAASSRFVGQAWLGGVIALAAFAALRAQWMRLPKAITAIGLVSYSLYIVHQNIGLIVIRETARWIPAFEARMALAFAVVMALAIALYSQVETRWQKSLASIISAALTTALSPLNRRRFGISVERQS